MKITTNNPKMKMPLIQPIDLIKFNQMLLKKYKKSAIDVNPKVQPNYYSI